MEYLEKWIMELAAEQGGVVRRSQLLDGGLTIGQIQRRRRSGLVEAINKFSYKIFEPQNHMDLLRGALVALPQGVVSHQSAAILHAFPTAPPSNPTVTVHHRGTHQFPGVTVRRCDDLDPQDTTLVRGLKSTTVERTVVDLAPWVSEWFLDRMTQDLIIDRRMSMDRFTEVVNRVARRGKSGSAALRSLLMARGDGNIMGQSELERLGGKLLLDPALPTFIPQYPIPWDDDKTWDHAAPGYLLALEWDSRKWHASVEAMDSDRQRDREAQAHGWLLLRFTWIDVTRRPLYVVREIKKVLAQREPQSRIS
ncbi:MAG: hypothetical protein GEU79_18835 [Acidimicrobiia bacterium]|nr:hypothetical protein [Acidimicrobiia bacterium]